ncbi:flagellar export chaperone FliS [Glaciihabitans sp. dw_435]|uniref:flagellar export chaperone FliS n=1 Tax=Glaciihabitans sp. dw_435 TaxID=2720081 RepID=UPI001BD30AD5|nr:flagellar export chaperone FliS [Glaciihabitans sp. dw_435]
MSLLNSRISEYNRNAVLSATPSQLLTMLYDRLLLDLSRAQLAQREERWQAASTQLIHAQAIIAELQSSLNVDEWDGAQGLMALYVYLNTAMINANINRDQALTAECIQHLEPLRQAWVQAASAGQSSASQGWGVA